MRIATPSLPSRAPVPWPTTLLQAPDGEGVARKAEVALCLAMRLGKKSSSTSPSAEPRWASGWEGR